MKFSLRAKTVILIIIIAAVLSISGILLSAQFIRSTVDSIYKDKAEDVAATVGQVINKSMAERLTDDVMAIYNSTEDKVGSEEWGSDEFNEYVAKYSEIEDSRDFTILREELRSVQDVNDIDCAYLAAVDPPTNSMVYLVDGAYEDACPPGCFDPLYDINKDLLTDPERGFPPYITDTEPYGRLVTAGVPVHGPEGDVICYALVDIPMDEIKAQQDRFEMTLSGMLLLLTFLICIISIVLIDRFVIDPINRLSSAAANYDAEKGSTEEIDSLSIRSKDEIQSLYSSIRKMTHDIAGYIDNLRKTSSELSQTKIQAQKMDDLAHKDALTGVGSKLAYDQKVQELSDEIKQGVARFGIAIADLNDLKKMNDNYGHEYGNMAIRKTCQTLCDVFSHSPVYRIGGDEFAVILKDRDYDNIEDLTSSFNSLIGEPSAAGASGPDETPCSPDADAPVTDETSGSPSCGASGTDETPGSSSCGNEEKAERQLNNITAAIGYALYSGEKTVDEVFRKADHRMYDRKKEMKAQMSD
ncbi:MAG: GGDEF domain-containing protein [Eubacterium sp.]|nr:GGDEF domain-containing protein [Eubacterium sp.]